MKTFEQALRTPSDINEHLPTLYLYACDCDSVVEIGLGTTSNAVRAFLKGCPKVISYDIDPMAEVVKDVQEYADHLGSNWEFRLRNSLSIEIPECDFLFIDGDHSYDIVKAELALHHIKVKQYIGFHDVVSYCDRNENGSSGVQGIVPAIFEFMKEHPQWKVSYYSPFNNGLLILINENT